MLKNETYDILKWIAILLLPALSAFVGTVGQALNYDNTGMIVIVINALAVFIGAIIGVSTKKYNQE